MDNQTFIHLAYTIVLGLSGLAVGSFLNVVIYRAPLGLSLMQPPSTCPSCGNLIAWYDNVPLLGWLVLRGKCRRCHAPISARYPLVELATGVLWAAEGWRLAGLAGGFYANVFTGLLELAFLSGLVVTVLVDWDHRIILDEVSLGGLAAALLASPFLPGMHHAATAADYRAFSPELFLLFGAWPAWARSLAASGIGAAAGLAFSLLLYWFGNAAFRKQIEAARLEDPEVDSALGLGDVKLMAFFGAWLGWRAVLVTFLAASISGALIGVVLKLASGTPNDKTGLDAWRERWRSGNSVMPFGPFLCFGAYLAFVLGETLTGALGWTGLAN